MKKLVLAATLAASMAGTVAITGAQAAGNTHSPFYKACATLKAQHKTNSLAYKFLDCKAILGG